MPGTCRRVVPVNNRIPKPTAITSNGTESQAVRPLVNGPPTTEPTNPAPISRVSAVVSAPEPMCHKPSAGSPTSNEPMMRRVRISGRGSVRISRIAIPTHKIGRTADTAPNTARTAVSIPPPIGPPAANHTLPATTTLKAMSPRAIPSRRWPASISPTLLTVRVVAPTPRAASDHPAAMPLPTTSSGLALCFDFATGRRAAEDAPDAFLGAAFFAGAFLGVDLAPLPAPARPPACDAVVTLRGWRLFVFATLPRELTLTTWSMPWTRTCLYSNLYRILGRSTYLP